MKKNISLLIVFLFLSNTTNIFGAIDFSSKDSTINLKHGSSFFNASNNIIIDGIIQKSDGSSIMGNTITFSLGNLETENFENINSPILWQNDKNIKLNNNTNLSTIWHFSGTNYLNGNGQTFDLSNNGKLILQPNAQLHLTDVYLKGLGDTGSRGQIIFMNDNCKVIISNSTIEIDRDVTTTIGGVYINGPTTCITNDNTWLFDQNASLTVDNVTLWKDSIGASTQGNITFGSFATNLDLVSNGTIKSVVSLDALSTTTTFLQEQITENSNAIVNLQEDVIENSNAIVNIESDLAIENSNAIVNIQEDVIENSSAIIHIGSLSTDLTVENSNAIVNNSSFISQEMIIQNSDAIVTCCTNPLNGNISGNITLDKSSFMDPTEQIVIADNAVIDGQGSILYFAGKDKPVGPQFVVSPGKSVTLNNIKLVGLVSDTFSMMSDSSQIIIGQNVYWGLDEHLTFTRGQININGQNVWNIQGIGGQKRLRFNPASPTNNPMVNLGLGTLALQNIELTGLQHLSNSTLGGIAGALGLVGNAAVNIEQSTSMVFYIESLANVFRLLENNLTFNGLLNYSDTGDSALHFDFVLRSPVESTDAKAQLQSGKVPVVNFATNFIYLTSLNGIARIIFDDAIVKVNNASDAFIVLENSYLAANKLQVSGDPIWDASDNSAKNRFAVEAIELEAVGFTSEIVPEFGIPIIVDPGHHRSILLNSLLTRYSNENELLDFLTKVDRPKSAIEIK